MKTLKDFDPNYDCEKMSPGFHIVGCSHKEWTKEQLKSSLDDEKQSNAYLAWLLSQKIQGGKIIK